MLKYGICYPYIVRKCHYMKKILQIHYNGKMNKLSEFDDKKYKSLDITWN